MPFSQPHADRALNFVERILKHTNDDWYGNPFLLAPWEEDIVSHLFGDLDDDGNRLIQMAYIEAVKKSGKTTLLAAIVLYALISDPNPGCQVYGVAAALRQAKNVYNTAAAMVDQSSILSKRLKVYRGSGRIIKRSDPYSFYAAVAADGDFTDGVNPSFVVADEVHRWKTRKMLDNWQVLSKGGITRKNALTVAITTAGIQNESPLAWQLHEKARKVNEGIVHDPRFFGRLYGASPTDDPSLESTWIKANPSLIPNGGFLPVSKIRDEYTTALTEGDLTSFKRYFLNIWDQKENRAIDMNQWRACRRPDDWCVLSDDHKVSKGWVKAEDSDYGYRLPDELVPVFAERKCWLGGDISMTTDLSALVAVFPRDDDENGGDDPNTRRYDVLCSCWMPEANVRKRELRDGVPYSKWIDQGFLETCPGNVIDTTLIMNRIRYHLEMFDVQEICFDRYNSREMSVKLVSEGIKVQEIPQNFMGMNEATKKFLRLVSTARLVHGNHPVLAHHASCLCTQSDKNDLIKPVKPDREKEISRIDLVAAAIDAFAREIEANDQESVYSTRGIRSL